MCSHTKPLRLPVSSTPIAQTELWSDRLTLLLESTGEGIFGVDMGGRCIFINRAGAAMLGYAPDEVLHQNMHDLIHHSHEDGRHYPENDCPIFNAFRRGASCRIDTEVLWRRDGSSFPAEYSSYPIIEHGEVRGAVATCVDISQRKHAEEMLRQSRDLLERRVSERTEKLSKALDQLRELSAYLDTVREEERTRIAREIHDELGSMLVALKMDVNWIGRRVSDKPELHAKCATMGRLIEAAVDNVGRIITDLRPSILDHQGLWAALEWQAREFAETSEIKCEWHMHVGGEAQAPSGRRAIAIFRIFQEMLSNIGRHAQAGSMRICIAMQSMQLAIQVVDDGLGAPPELFESPRAYGVLGMRERAGHFGGKVDIFSAPGAGTRVLLQMPLTASKENPQ
jgi:PAS domain S-box-containing protein